MAYKSGIVLTQSTRLDAAKLKAKTEGTLRKALIMGERTVVIKAMFFTTELTENTEKT